VFRGSGGETRTHNLRINSPIQRDPLTRQNASYVQGRGVWGFRFEGASL
jgi:hypothetical protein